MPRLRGVSKKDVNEIKNLDLSTSKKKIKAKINKI